MVKYRLPLLSVRNVEISKQFYCDLLEQEVTLDLGRNVTFSGGFAIQEDFSELVDVPKSTVLSQTNNMELYFETDDFDAFMARMSKFPELDLVHTPKIHEWYQRVVRIYDPDWHMIEVGESMETIARRFVEEGRTIDETAKLIQHPAEYVRRLVEGDAAK